MNTKRLNLGLVGYGKMGKMVEVILKKRSHNLLEPDQADIIIDFTHPDAALENIQKYGEMGKNIVMGTTGWYDKLPEVEKMVEEYQIGMLWAPNFSLGVNLFLQVVHEAAKRYLSYPEYKVAGIEWHHDQKKDAPSGTAIALQEAIEKPCEFASVRCGTIPGTHQILFDSEADLITLTHEARSREGFALGAVVAAEWLQDKKGLFTLKDTFS
ncbi:MAG: dihydrodipicolinate reductase [Chlamydiia bacterium]|nr:dihydrodipicolinate reductase [Chlamydiia bacterium]